MGCFLNFLAEAGETPALTPLNNFLYGESMFFNADNFEADLSNTPVVVAESLFSGVATSPPITEVARNATDFDRELFRTESSIETSPGVLFCVLIVLLSTSVVSGFSVVASVSSIVCDKLFNSPCESPNFGFGAAVVVVVILSVCFFFFRTTISSSLM
jgi:hypothetical protein